MECLVIIENENVHKNYLLLLSCSVNLGPLLEESPLRSIVVVLGQYVENMLFKHIINSGYKVMYNFYTRTFTFFKQNINQHLCIYACDFEPVLECATKKRYQLRPRPDRAVSSTTRYQPWNFRSPDYIRVH